jgi:type III pantothenate kinase
MLLAIDAGNTNVKLGVYRGRELLKKWRLAHAELNAEHDSATEVQDLFDRSGIDIRQVDAVIIASVVPQLNGALRQMSEHNFRLTPNFIDHTTNTGLKLLYDDPSELGADRIAGAVAAVEKCGTPCIVVDFGTATTFNAINAAREFVGGIIAPGIMTAAEALFARAAKLPRVAIERPQKFVGTSTAEALQSGLFYGYASLVDGLIRGMMLQVQGPLATTVIATGGLAHLMQNASEYIHDIDPNLTLDGLRFIHDRA